MSYGAFCVFSGFIAALNLVLYGVFGFWPNLAAGVFTVFALAVAGLLWISEGWR